MTMTIHKLTPADPPKIGRTVPVVWETLEDAFENNAPEVSSFLHLETGEVIRVVDGAADSISQRTAEEDPLYLRVDPVSSREQYRWMERFIETVEEGELKKKLAASIDGKGAFRRFKDALMTFPIDRERWFSFRSERLRSCIQAWLAAQGLQAVERPEWRVPTAEDVRPQAEQQENERPGRRNRAALADTMRKRLVELAAQLPVRELDAAVAFLEFLRERKHLPRLEAKGLEATPNSGTFDAPSKAGATNGSNEDE